MSNPAPSSHSSREPQPVNPYAASQVAAAHVDSPVEMSNERREYRILMDWADRYRFLQSVGPLRFYAIAGAVLVVWAMIGLLQTGFEMSQMAGRRSWSDVILAIRLLISFTRGVLGLYLSWIHWRFADTIATTAGGKSGSMRRWSQLQLRSTHVLLATMVITMVAQGWEWLVGAYLLDFLASPN